MIRKVRVIFVDDTVLMFFLGFFRDIVRDINLSETAARNIDLIGIKLRNVFKKNNWWLC